MNKYETILPEPTPEERRHESEMILLAEFVGAKFGVHGRSERIFNSSNEYYWGERYAIDSWLFEEFVGDENDGVYYPSEMRFKEDWNWLMMIVEKIGGIIHPKFEDDSLRGRIIIATHKSAIDWGENTLGPDDTFYNFKPDETMMERTYDVCIRFVKWYRENAKEINV